MNEAASCLLYIQGSYAASGGGMQHIWKGVPETFKKSSSRAAIVPISFMPQRPTLPLYEKGNAATLSLPPATR